MSDQNFALEIVPVDGEYRIDSRIVADRLGISHKAFLETVRKYQGHFEKLGILPFKTEVVKGHNGGGNPTKYAMLNEDQCVFASTLSRNTDNVVDFKLALTIAFKEARNNVPQAVQIGITNNLWRERDRLFSAKTKIPYHLFCVFQELTDTFYRAEERGGKIPENAVPDISVGKLWKTYASNILRFDMSLAKNYPHHYPDHRGIRPANLYPIEWLPAFRKWLAEVYLPVNMPKYLKGLGIAQLDVKRIMSSFGVSLQIAQKGKGGKAS